MSKLVMKLLRKGESPQDQKVRKRLGTLGSGVGVGVNALLAAGKLIIGSLTGSPKKYTLQSKRFSMESAT